MKKQNDPSISPCQNLEQFPFFVATVREFISSPDLGGHGWVFPVTFPCAPDLPDPLPDPTPINQVEGDPR